MRFDKVRKLAIEINPNMLKLHVSNSIARSFWEWSWILLFWWILASIIGNAFYRLHYDKHTNYQPQEDCVKRACMQNLPSLFFFWISRLKIKLGKITDILIFEVDFWTDQNLSYCQNANHRTCCGYYFFMTTSQHLRSLIMHKAWAIFMLILFS